MGWGKHRESPQGAERVESANNKEVNRNLPRAEHTYAACGLIRESPIFKMKRNGKESDVIFDTGSTVNILRLETLVEHLGIPKKFVQ